jgi:trigger factor
VKAKKLPEANDEFARSASEFDTLEELREDVRGKFRQLREADARAVVRDRLLTKLIESADIDLPERLVEEGIERHVEAARQRATRAGTTLEDALAAQGWDEERFRTDAHAHVVRDLQTDLVLEAVAKAEDITVTEEDLAREVTNLSEATGKNVGEVARLLEKTGQVGTLAGDIIRSKALDLLVEAADVDLGGAPNTSDAETSTRAGGPNDE